MDIRNAVDQQLRSSNASHFNIPMVHPSRELMRDIQRDIRGDLRGISGKIHFNFCF